MSDEEKMSNRNKKRPVCEIDKEKNENKQTVKKTNKEDTSSLASTGECKEKMRRSSMQQLIDDNESEALDIYAIKGRRNTNVPRKKQYVHQIGFMKVETNFDKNGLKVKRRPETSTHNLVDMREDSQLDHSWNKDEDSYLQSQRVASSRSRTRVLSKTTEVSVKEIPDYQPSSAKKLNFCTSKLDTEGLVPDNLNVSSTSLAEQHLSSSNDDDNEKSNNPHADRKVDHVDNLDVSCDEEKNKTISLLDTSRSEISSPCNEEVCDQNSKLISEFNDDKGETGLYFDFHEKNDQEQPMDCSSMQTQSIPSVSQCSVNLKRISPSPLNSAPCENEDLNLFLDASSEKDACSEGERNVNLEVDANNTSVNRTTAASSSLMESCLSYNNKDLMGHAVTPNKNEHYEDSNSIINSLEKARVFLGSQDNEEEGCSSTYSSVSNISSKTNREKVKGQQKKHKRGILGFLDPTRKRKHDNSSQEMYSDSEASVDPQKQPFPILSECRRKYEWKQCTTRYLKGLNELRCDFKFQTNEEYYEHLVMGYCNKSSSLGTVNNNNETIERKYKEYLYSLLSVCSVKYHKVTCRHRDMTFSPPQSPCRNQEEENVPKDNIANSCQKEQKQPEECIAKRNDDTASHPKICNTNILKENITTKEPLTSSSIASQSGLQSGKNDKAQESYITPNITPSQLALTKKTNNNCSYCGTKLGICCPIECPQILPCSTLNPDEVLGEFDLDAERRIEIRAQQKDSLFNIKWKQRFDTTISRRKEGNLEESEDSDSPEEGMSSQRSMEASEQSGMTEMDAKQYRELLYTERDIQRIQPLFSLDKCMEINFFRREFLDNENKRPYIPTIDPVELRQAIQGMVRNDSGKVVPSKTFFHRSAASNRERLEAVDILYQMQLKLLLGMSSLDTIVPEGAYKLKADERTDRKQMIKLIRKDVKQMCSTVQKEAKAETAKRKALQLSQKTADEMSPAELEKMTRHIFKSNIWKNIMEQQRHLRDELADLISKQKVIWRGKPPSKRVAHCILGGTNLEEEIRENLKYNFDPSTNKCIRSFMDFHRNAMMWEIAAENGPRIQALSNLTMGEFLKYKVPIPETDHEIIDPKWFSKYIVIGVHRHKTGQDHLQYGHPVRLVLSKSLQRRVWEYINCCQMVYTDKPENPKRGWNRHHGVFIKHRSSYLAPKQNGVRVGIALDSRTGIISTQLSRFGIKMALETGYKFKNPSNTKIKMHRMRLLFSDWLRNYQGEAGQLFRTNMPALINHLESTALQHYTDADRLNTIAVIARVARQEDRSVSSNIWNKDDSDDEHDISTSPGSIAESLQGETVGVLEAEKHDNLKEQEERHLSRRPSIHRQKVMPQERVWLAMFLTKNMPETTEKHLTWAKHNHFLQENNIYKTLADRVKHRKLKDPDFLKKYDIRKLRTPLSVIGKTKEKRPCYPQHTLLDNLVKSALRDSWRTHKKNPFNRYFFRNETYEDDENENIRDANDNTSGSEICHPDKSATKPKCVEKVAFSKSPKLQLRTPGKSEEKLHFSPKGHLTRSQRQRFKNSQKVKKKATFESFKKTLESGSNTKGEGSKSWKSRQSRQLASNVAAEIQPRLLHIVNVVPSSDEENVMEPRNQVPNYQNPFDFEDSNDEG